MIRAFRWPAGTVCVCSHVLLPQEATTHAHGLTRTQGSLPDGKVQLATARPWSFLARRLPRDHARKRRRWVATRRRSPRPPAAASRPSSGRAFVGGASTIKPPSCSSHRWKAWVRVFHGSGSKGTGSHRPGECLGWDERTSCRARWVDGGVVGVRFRTYGPPVTRERSVGALKDVHGRPLPVLLALADPPGRIW